MKYTYMHIIRNPCWNKVRGTFNRRGLCVGAGSLKGSAKRQVTARVFITQVT